MRQMIVAAALAIQMAGAASAATLTPMTFDGASLGDTVNYQEAGLTVDVARIVGENCSNISDKPCMALNDNEASVLTEAGGGLFTLIGFWFQLLGDGTDNTLLVETDKGSLSLAVSGWGSNLGGDFIPLMSPFTDLAYFTEVSYVKFSTNTGGNVRIDDLTRYTPAEVPVPAAGLLLAGGLGMVAAIRRRHSKLG